MKLRTFLPLLFGIQLLGTSALLAGISIWSKIQDTNALSMKLRSQMVSRIESDLETFVQTPQQVVQNNINQMELGLIPDQDLLSPESRPILEQFLLKQSRIFPEISYILLSNDKGEFLGVEKLDTGERNIEVANANSGGNFYTFATNEQGEVGTSPIKPPSANYDPRRRPFYEAAKNGKLWSPVYQTFGHTNRLTITAVAPLKDDQGQVIAVAGVDLILSQISQYLQDLEISDNGSAFLFDLETGRLLAGSTPEDVEWSELKGHENPSVQSIYNLLLEEFGSLDQVPDGYPTELSIMGEPTYLQVQRLKAEGLDWLIGITIPRRDLTAQSERNTNLIIIFSIFATGLSVGLGILVARQIMEPLDVLSEQAEAIANDDLSIDLEPLQKLKAQNNELAAFARILEKTAKEVVSRTKAMKAEIKTLKVEIDQQKKEKQVKEIIETDFFKELELKAKTLRDRY